MRSKIISEGVSFTKHILPRAFELFQHRVQSPQRDALFTPFQPENGGWRQTHFLGKLSERHVPTLIP